MSTLYVRSDSKFIWARIKGAPRQSTGVPKEGRNKTETERLWREAQKWADKAEERLRTEGAPFTVEQAVAAARAEQEFHNRAPSTLERGRVSGAHIGRVLDWDANLHAIDKPPRFAEQYVRTRRHEGATDHTISKEWNFLLMGLRRAKRESEFRGDPGSFKVPALHGCYEPRTRWLPIEELRLLLEAEAEASSLYPQCVSRRDWILGLYFTGARHGELHNIRKQDVNLAKRELLIRGTKTKSAHRPIPIFDDLVPVLERRIEVAPTEYLFRPTWQKGRANANLKAWCRKAGIARCSPNDFRRSFATVCAEQGIAESLTVKFLGHTSSNMVRRVYGQVSERMRTRAIVQFGSVLDSCADEVTPIEKAWEYRDPKKAENE